MPDSLDANHSDSTTRIEQDSQGNQNQIIGQAVSSTIVNVTGGGQVTIYQSQLERAVAADAPSQSATLGPNPYKGLLAFQERDGDRFFGRGQQIGQLWQQFQALHTAEATIRVLSIYGPSGSGKSSLARAGLIPELARRPLPGRENARVALLVPGTHPLTTLATVLARVATNDPTPVEKAEEFERVLQKPSESGDYGGLRRIAEALPDSALSPLIVLVDQFEEVYTLCEGKAERDAFVANLLHAAADRSQRVSVILTLRSDFLGETQKHPVLNGLFAEQGFLVRSMTQAELRQAIAEPARQAGHSLDTATVDLLVKDTEGREGALPLLQFALTRIWEGLAAGKEPAETLKAIGGVGGALAGEAQQIYDSLSPAQQEIARRMFLGLVQLGEGTKDTRRRAELQQVVSYRDDPEQVKQVIARFSGSGARLITLAATDDARFETAEVTHEALLDHWQQLKSWLEGSRSDIRFQRRLDEAAKYWDGNGRPEGSLWRSPDLDLLRRYQQRSGDDMTPLQVEFFQASERAAKRSQQVRRVAFGGLITGSVLITGLAGFALYQLQQAQRQRVEQLAAVAKVLLPNQPVDALVNALVANELSQSFFVQFPDHPSFTSAEDVLLDAVRVNRELNRIPQEDIVVSVAFSPDGKRIVSGSQYNTVRVWDAATGQEIGSPFKGHESVVSSVAFSPDGKRIVSGSYDNTVQLWDAQTGQALGTLKGHEAVVNSVAFSPDGKQIVSGSLDKTVRLWDAQTWQPIGSPFKGHQDAVFSVAFSPDGKQIVSGSLDKTVRLWDTATGQAMGAPLKGHEDAIRSVAFSPDGKQIVSSSVDKTLRLWNAQTGQAMGAPLKGHEDEVSSVAFSPDGKQIVSGSLDKTLRLWNAQTGQAVGAPLKGHEDLVSSVAFSPDGKQIVSSSVDKTLRLWNAQTGQALESSLTGHEDAVFSVAFSPDGKQIVSGSMDKTLRQWNAATGQAMGLPLKGHKDAVFSVAFSPDGKQIVSGSMDKTLRLWDAQTGQALEPSLTGHEDLVWSVAFSPDSKQIVSASGDQTLRLWDARTGQALGAPLRGHENAVYSVAFSLDGKHLVSGSRDQTLRLWDTRTGQALGGHLLGHEDVVFSVAFNPDSKLLVSASWDKTVRLWDAQTGQAVGAPLKGHEDKVYSVAFSSDGTRIVSGSGDKTVRLWDAATGQAIGSPLKGHQAAVFSVAFSPDGRRIVSGSGDKTVRIWDLSWEKLLRMGCGQLRYHLVLTQPTTDVAKAARQTCEQYAWK